MEIISVSLSSLSESLNEYFSDQSIYYKPAIEVGSYLKQIESQLRNKVIPFHEIDPKLKFINSSFGALKVLNNDLKSKGAKFTHYTTKIRNLKSAKLNKKIQGKSLSKKNINRLSRNELKLSNSRDNYLSGVKSIQSKIYQTKNESLDLICPLISTFSFNLSTLGLRCQSAYQGLSKAYDTFLQREDSSKYELDIYKQVIFEDPRFENVKDSAFSKHQSSSFLNFYEKRQNKEMYDDSQLPLVTQKHDHQIPQAKKSILPSKKSRTDLESEEITREHQKVPILKSRLPFLDE